MHCLLCGSDRIQNVDTIISDFVYERIHPQESMDGGRQAVKLCFCKDCTFAFYDYRFSAEEEQRLYHNYRDSEYQKQREKHECWYTARVNDAINHSGVLEQQRVIATLLAKHIHREISVALDYGGNRGETFYSELGTGEKYVYDISGVKPVHGVQQIASYDELLTHSYDFIMCNMVLEHVTDPMDVMRKLHQLGNRETVYYLEVPSENPFIKGNKFSLKKNLNLLCNRNYNWLRLAKAFLQQLKQPFMPMKEHINFFTPESIRIMLKRCGFVEIALQEEEEKGPLGSSTVLSVLFKADYPS